MLSFFILGLLLLTAMLWMLLERHESRRASAGKPRHSGLRLLFAAIGILAVLFSAGVALIFFSELSSSGGKPYFGWPVIVVFAGFPFVAGLVIWWLAMRRRSE